MDGREVSLTHGNGLWICRDGASALEHIMNMVVMQPDIAPGPGLSHLTEDGSRELIRPS
jgi:hypothetical protein